MNDHDCASRDDIREISESVGSLKTDVAMVKKDTMDLKELSASMSKCIEALTKSSIISRESHITRDQFYKELKELAATRQEIVNACMGQFNAYKELAEKRMDALESQAEKNKNVCDDYKEIKKWVIGLIISFVGFLLVQGYMLLVK